MSSIPPRSPRLPGAGDIVAGKYRLERLLKQGGMGAVWIATHLGLDERVAVKFMDPRRVSSSEARIRFTREAKAAAQIRSKNIVQILDHGVDANVPYIAMELLEGEDLGVRLRRVGRMTLAAAAELLQHVAHALDRAHAAGIVHRDLKPENIFLARDGDHEMPKILDFGIALEVQPDASDDSATTQEGLILGTPYFMSPEQVRGRSNIDHRSDLWSLGVILFRAITGIRPFGRGAPADVIVQICSDPIPRASVVARDLPGEVDQFFEKALAREVSKRFASAKEMAAAFTDIAKLAEVADRTPADTADGASERTTGVRWTRKTPPPMPVAYAIAKTIPVPGTPPPPEVANHDRAALPGIEIVPATTPDPPWIAEANAAEVTAPAVARGAEREPSGEPVEVTRPSSSAIVTPLPSTVISSSTTPSVVVASVAPASVVAPSEVVPSATRSSAAAPVSGTVAGGRSVILVGLVGAAIAAVLIGSVFRERLFAPPPAPRQNPSGATTIVLTAGTVMLMAPAGAQGAPAEVILTTPPAATAPPSATPTTSASAAATATSAASAGAKPAPATTAPLKGTLRPSGTTPDNKPPAELPPAKKTPPDLGY